MNRSAKQKIREIRNTDKTMVAKFIAANWGATVCISKGRKYKPAELPGFICKENNNIVGLVTYRIEKSYCEITTLNSCIKKSGLGRELIKKVIEVAINENCDRIWVITTNDNTNAIMFYQKMGFEWSNFYKDAMQLSRKIKHEIPELGFDNIPIKHEIEFELILI